MTAALQPDSSFWHGKRVLVTGATGVLGGVLVRTLLGAGSSVVVLVRDADYRSELYRSGDIRRVATVTGQLQDLETVERAISEHEVDTVFHLGAQTIVGTAARFPLQTFESNIRGTYTLLEACRIHSELVERVVVASSDKAYGDYGGRPYSEEDPLLARNPYDVSKACADLLAQSYFHSFGLPVAIVRCGNIYGRGDLNWSRLIPGTIRSLFFGDRPVIRSDGKFIRDYLYVMDAVNAYLTVAYRMDAPAVQGNAFNFSGESPCAVIDVVHEIAALMERQDLQMVIENRAAGEIRQQVLSTAKARTVLNWEPQYELRSGLRETIAWYCDFLDEDKMSSK